MYNVLENCTLIAKMSTEVMLISLIYCQVYILYNIGVWCSDLVISELKHPALTASQRTRLGKRTLSWVTEQFLHKLLTAMFLT